MKNIAFFPVTALGDAIAEMGQLEELHRLYAPCRITVFAIPLIAELYGNYVFCDEAVELVGGIRGPVHFREVPKRHFDLVFNHGYHESWSEMLRQMDYEEAYGMEEINRSKEVCDELFRKWVPLEYWNEIVLTKWQFVSQQMAEIIRLVNPEYENGCPCLNEQNYRCTCPKAMPSGRYALFLPGTSSLIKYWPIQKYMQLAELLKKQGIEPLFVLGPQDRSLIDDIHPSGYALFDNLSLSELAYCMIHAELVLGNDMGPMHLAACLNVPSVHFFSFTGAHNWFQYDKARHKLVMPECGRRDGDNCGKCCRSCIGKISIMLGYRACQELLDLPDIELRHIGYFAQDLIGDALVHINDLEELSRFFAPCEITVFCTRTNAPMFERYAFCDHVFCYEQGNWPEDALPREEFDAIFNTRYDADSVKMLQKLNHRHAYGYENVEIPQDICRKVYDAWLLLTMWDDEILRYNTSVTEQGAALIRLVNPAYHHKCIHLAVNTFIHEYSASNHLKRNMVLLVRGASNRYKDWGTKNYLELAHGLKQRGYVPVFLFGPAESIYVQETTDAGYPFISGLNFGEIACLMNATAYTKCIIGNDTGLMHLACALDVPSVTISAGESHFVWFPYERQRHKVCHPSCSSQRCLQNCNNWKNCISIVAVNDVLATVDALLGEH